MSALEGLRRQIESTNTRLGEVLEKIQDLSARVDSLEEGAARPAAATTAPPSRVTMPPAQSTGKPTSGPTSTTKSATGKS